MTVTATPKFGSSHGITVTVTEFEEPGQLWQAAYHLNRHNKSFTGEMAREVLQELYEDKTFLPSVHLMHLNEKDYQPR